MVAIKIYELISTLEDRVRAQNGVYKPEMVPEISWGWSWEGEVKCGAGNAWRSDIVKKDLGLRGIANQVRISSGRPLWQKIQTQNPSLHLGMH